MYNTLFMAPILPLQIALNGLTKTVTFHTTITQLNDSFQQITGGNEPSITWQLSTIYANNDLINNWTNLLEQYGGYSEFDLDLDFLGVKTFRCLEYLKEDTHHDYGLLTISLIQS